MKFEPKRLADEYMEECRKSVYEDGYPIKFHHFMLKKEWEGTERKFMPQELYKEVRSLVEKDWINVYIGYPAAYFAFKLDDSFKMDIFKASYLITKGQV